MSTITLRKMSTITLRNLIFSIAILMVACEKESVELNMDKGGDDTFPVTESTLHLTCTNMIEAGADETLFSFTLASDAKDAVIYYSVDDMSFSKSIFLSSGYNIIEESMDAGPADKGVKVVLPSVNIKGKTELRYYFKIVRQNTDEKILHFGFEKLTDDKYYITDSNRIESEQEFCYYIKADEAGNPCYINVKFN
ncbi:MAG: hypothetical protein ACFCUM_10475 [Bacteroidales bacterium]